MVLSTEWSQVEVIDLVNDGNGIGFILVGGRSTGVVIKALTPGGVAERDGRLQCGDHVLQIGDVNLRGFSSEQVATVLRQTGAHVRLIVARSVESSASEYQTLASHAPIIPTKLLSDPDELTRQLYRNPAISTSAGCFIPSPDTELPDFPLPPIPTDIVPSSTSSHRVCPKHLDIVPMCGNYAGTSDRDKNVIDMPGTTVLQVSAMMSNYVDTPETVTYEVELRKNVYGLGITVAGYVCEEEELSGIFVKSIIEGSAAEMSRKIQINDRIVAVDGKTLAGVTNHQAVEILRNTDIIVHLTLERFLRGRKYEHLQVALIEAKGDTQSQISLPASPSIATLSWVAAKSDADSIATDEMMEVPIECELASHTTLDSNMSMVLDNSENDDSGQSSPGENGIEETQLNDEIQICIINGNANGNGKDTSRTPSVGDSPSRLNTPTPTPSLDSLQAAWKSECPDSEIIVAEINKLSGLGFSLEGTVDVECGIELRPHHYIRSILEDGPVGKQGIFKPGDELLQVNEHKLQGLMHTEVVKILKELPGQVKLVCGRGPSAPSIINTSQNAEAFESRSLLTGGHQSLQGLLTKAQSESSLYTSSTATLTDQQRSKSVENISGLALWCTDVTYIEIEKTERGFGFSVLDYQDPLDSEGTVIVIRGLIPGGSAEATNQIFPGDRLVSVAENSLHGLTLDEAVSILKGTTPGIIKIGICRPLSTSDNNIASPPDTPST